MAINLANNNSLANITALPSSISGGAMTLLATQTASSSSTISFTSGIDDTYDSYVFKFYDIHPSHSGRDKLLFQTSINGGSNYNVACTDTVFDAYHDEANGTAELSYDTNADAAQSTSFIQLTPMISNQNDACASGTLTLFNPSSTTFVKHFIFTGAISFESGGAAPYIFNRFTGGYFNTTNAINAIQFKMESANIDSGVIKLYGIS